MPDMEEPLNVDMEPEDALRVLLGVEEREPDPEDEDEEKDERKENLTP